MNKKKKQLFDPVRDLSEWGKKFFGGDNKVTASYWSKSQKKKWNKYKK